MSKLFQSGISEQAGGQSHITMKAHTGNTAKYEASHQNYRTFPV